ncbi:MAG: hypothetical protein KDD46_04830, partial [Bdellovibrionales bacterium]|nr:hypothetical protein [Bdellovibrionales bacterium]
MLDRTQIVEQNFLKVVESYQPVTRIVQTDTDMLKMLFLMQVQSRLLDYQSRVLKAQNESFYTIGSAGHEANAVFGALLKKEDPCLLHYRSGAFMMARACVHDYPHMIEDTLLSFCASKLDPTSGGRHKVWGSKTLWVPPQTSTIASHLPKAVGMSFGIRRAHHMQVPTDTDKDSIVFVSFGDASCNHATAQTAFNAASWSAYQKLPTPIFFLCEDNGLGISVRTPKGWVEHMMKARGEIKYFSADSAELDQVVVQAKEAIEYCRAKRKPVFFHLSTIRLFGHAGSDVETGYRTLEEIESMEGFDPIIATAKLLMDAGIMDKNEIRLMYESEKKSIEEKSKKAVLTPKLQTAQEVMEYLTLPSPKSVTLQQDEEKRKVVFTKAIGHVPEQSPKPRHMAMLLNWALYDLMIKDPSAVLFGEDVAKKGGVYHV